MAFGRTRWVEVQDPHGWQRTFDNFTVWATDVGEWAARNPRQFKELTQDEVLDRVAASMSPPQPAQPAKPKQQSRYDFRPITTTSIRAGAVGILGAAYTFRQDSSPHSQHQSEFSPQRVC